MARNRSKIKVEDVLIGLSLLAGIIGCLWPYFSKFDGQLSNDQSIFGAFGDYVGGIIGTLLSFLSIVYIYRTYKKQVEFSEEQQRLTIIQSFESSFFNLLHHQHEILMSLRHDDSEGYAYIQKIVSDLQLRLSDREYGLEEITPANKEREREIIDEVYQELYSKYGSDIGHYFRSLYHILVYIEESEMRNKQRYYKLVQAQLCNNELYLLFYNSISHYGKKKMYPLVETHGILENLRYSEFSYFKKHQTLFYPQTNFKIDEP